MLDEKSRLAFLTRLSQQFCPTDRWHLHQILSSQGSYFDIVGNLPTELAIQILSYLEPREIIPYRGVNRRWHRLLTAESMCSALLREWYPAEEAIVRQHDQGSRRRAFENAVSRERAVRRPHLCKRIPMPLRKDAYILVPWAVGGRIAFLGPNSRSIDIHQLDPGSDPQAVGGLAVPARTALDWVQLLDDYVMAATRDTAQVWVWQIGTLERHTFRLPNAVRAVETNGNLAVFRWRGGMSMYDASTRNMVDLGHSGRCDGIYIDARTQIFGVLDLCRPSMKIYSTVSGELLQEINNWLPNPTQRGSVPVGRRGRCAYHLFVIDPHLDSPHLLGVDGNSKDDIYTHATVFDSRACRIVYQRLRFKGIRHMPRRVDISDGNIHAVLGDDSGIAIATHVPMVTHDDYTNGSFFDVNFTMVHSKEWGLADPTAFMFPLHSLSLDKAVFVCSKPPFDLMMITYEGIHGHREEGEDEMVGAVEGQE